MAKDIIKNFVGFVGHYTKEVANIAQALEMTLRALPIDAQDRANILEITGKLKELPELLKEIVVAETTVKVHKDDLKAVLAEVLPALIAAEYDKRNAHQLPIGQINAEGHVTIGGQNEGV